MRGLAHSTGRMVGGMGRGRGVGWLRWYEWIVIVGLLDVLLTWCVMQLGAEEANRVAAAVVRSFGPVGLVMTKLVALVGFVAMCELVRRRRPEMAQAMVLVGLAVWLVPVVVGAATFAEVRWYATMPEYWAALWWGPEGLR